MVVRRDGLGVSARELAAGNRCRGQAHLRPLGIVLDLAQVIVHPEPEDQDFRVNPGGDRAEYDEYKPGKDGGEAKRMKANHNTCDPDAREEDWWQPEWTQLQAIPDD